MDRQIQIIIIVLGVLILLPLVSSLTIQQNTNYTLTFYPRVDGGITDTICNTTILYPNSSIMVDFEALNDLSDKFTYNLSDSQTSLKGEYTGSVTCISGSENETISFSYLVNLGGVEPSQQRTDTMTRTLYLVFIMGILFFGAIIFVEKLPIKATLALLGLLFFLIGINIIFITLQDEVVNSSLENFFSFFTSISFIIYWGIGVVIGVIWLLTFFVTLFEGMRSTKEARNSL